MQTLLLNKFVFKTTVTALSNGLTSCLDFLAVTILKKYLFLFNVILHLELALQTETLVWGFIANRMFLDHSMDVMDVNHLALLQCRI